jgi:hypothetical protein
VWLSCGGGWWALAAGGVTAVASGSNWRQEGLCKICMSSVKASGQAGRLAWESRALIRVRRRSMHDEIPAQD